MADREHENSLTRGDQEWRAGRDWREGGDSRGRQPEREAGRPGPGSFERNQIERNRGERDMRGARDERPASYEQTGGPYEPGGAGARGYGQGGDTSFGQMANGSSDNGLGGFGGADVGGYGQPNLNSQSGQGGYAPLNQGIDYGQDGGRFGPRGYDAGRFGQSDQRSRADHRPAQPQDHHEVSYHSWRETQLSGHDRDYARWREEQTRRYDEDYGSWRNERHAAFSKEFEGWRTGRGGQAAPQPTGTTTPPGQPGTATTVNPSEQSAYGQASASSTAGAQGFAHGANPTLARIADGDDGHHRSPAKSGAGEDDPNP